MSSSSHPDPLACNYISFVNNGQAGNLQITFDGQDNQLWYLQIIKAIADNNHTYDIAVLNGQNYGEYIVENFGQYQWVALVADLIQGSNGDYLYSAHLSPTVVDENIADLPTTISLLGNYPNPFNSSTVISLDSPLDASATITVYDIGGRKILEKSSSIKTGRNSISLNFDPGDIRGISSGVFYYTVLIADKKITGKMLYLK